MLSDVPEATDGKGRITIRVVEEEGREGGRREAVEYWA